MTRSWQPHALESRRPKFRGLRHVILITAAPGATGENAGKAFIAWDEYVFGN